MPCAALVPTALIPLLERLDQAQVSPDEGRASFVPASLLPHLFRVCLRPFLHPMRLENGLEHDLAESLLLDLAVSLGLGCDCR